MFPCIIEYITTLLSCTSNKWQAEELATEGCLNAINSLLICGEYSSLFTTEEMNDLLQVHRNALMADIMVVIYVASNLT